MGLAGLVVVVVLQHERTAAGEVLRRLERHHKLHFLYDLCHIYEPDLGESGI